jgi:hypothetical protein
MVVGLECKVEHISLYMHEEEIAGKCENELGGKLSSIFFFPSKRNDLHSVEFCVIITSYHHIIHTTSARGKDSC